MQNIQVTNNLLAFTSLVSCLKDVVASIEDSRTGTNCVYSLEDIFLSAFSVFFTQSPSFLSHQKLMQQSKGKNNSKSVFGIKNIPSDTHIRRTLDKVNPTILYSVFWEMFSRLSQSNLLPDFHFLDSQLLIAIDGTSHFSSNTIRCHKCSSMNHKNGDTTYFHNSLMAVIVCPNNNQVINLAPELLMPQENTTKQDSESSAMKRWVSINAKYLSNHKVTFLGDDLYSNQPMIKTLQEGGFHYIFTCKEPSHRYLYEVLSFLESRNSVKQLEEVKYEGHKNPRKMIYQYRFCNDVPLRKEYPITGNWAELIIFDENGKRKFKTACVTDHKITELNVVDIIRANRSRWKIENENNNQLKTRGYHLEHNFGHGKENLTSVLLLMNLLAFLFHTILHLTDTAYRAIRQVRGRRQAFFDDIKTLMCYLYFDDWIHLLNFMVERLEIKLEPD